MEKEPQFLKWKGEDFVKKHSKVEHEKIDGIVVPVEKLIPDIKPRPSVEKKEDTIESHDFSDMFAEKFPEEFSRIFKKTTNYHRVNKRLQDGLRNQILVDLGAGNHFGYIAAIVGGAKGYVGVDKFVQSCIPDKNSIENNPKLKELPLVPASWEVEDMLEFLKRLPDNSVSVVCSGQSHVWDWMKYGDIVKKEVLRVLHPEGFYIANDSNIQPDEKEFECLNKGRIEIYIKKTQQRADELKKIEEELIKIKEEISKITDIKTLEAMLIKEMKDPNGDEEKKYIMNDRYHELKNSPK